MKFLRLAGYGARTAFRSIRNAWLLQSITVATIATAFVILGGGFLFFHNLRAMVVGSKGTAHISVYLKAGLETAARRKVSAYCQESFVRKCSYRSTAEARKVFMGSNPELRETVGSLKENPFPASVEFDLNPDMRDPLKVKNLANVLRALEGVEAVDDGGKWYERWITLLRFLDWILWTLGLCVGGAMVFIVANTIRLMVYARRDEIEILNLVGASDLVTKFPFLLEGVVQGAVGAGMALLTLRFIFSYAQHTLLNQFGVLFSTHVTFLSPAKQVFFVLLGAFLGMFGSFLAVRRFLRS